MAHERVAIHTGITVLMLTGAVLLLPKRTLYYTQLMFRLWAWVCSLVVIVQVMFHVEPMGFIGNPGMNACLIAVLSPLLWQLFVEDESKLWRWVHILPPALAIVLSGASQPVALFALCSTVYLFMTYPRALKLTFPLMAILFILGPLLFWQESFTADTGRYAIWRLMRDDFWQNRSHFFGVGPGESLIYIPSVQIEAKYGAGGNAWIWFHSDWLQLIYEQGYVGGVLYGAVLLLALKRVYKNAAFLSCTLGMALLMVANFPFRSPIHTVWATILGARIFRRDG
jgi:hypothetical protein